MAPSADDGGIGRPDDGDFGDNPGLAGLDLVIGRKQEPTSLLHKTTSLCGRDL
jgi:hypothetical protein